MKNIELEIEEIFLDDNMKGFEEVLEDFGIKEPLQKATSKYLKNRLEELIELAEEGSNPELLGKKKELKELLKNLESVKDKRAEIEALQEIYSKLQDYNLGLGDLDKELKESLKEVKKYEHFKKHEENIVRKWLRKLDRKANREEKKEEREEKRAERKEEKLERKAEKEAEKEEKGEEKEERKAEKKAEKEERKAEKKAEK